MDALISELNISGIEEVIHGATMLVKPIPDPRDDTPMDPRVYERRKEEATKDNPMAGYEEVPVELVRAMPAEPSIDLVGDEVQLAKEVITTRNGEIPLYIMKPVANRVEPRPILFFIHGGAFIAGSTAYTVPFCKVISKEADAIVIGIDYHLSPEHHFPVALHDCYDALDWIYENAERIGGDRNRIAVGGDSAGGTLAIGTAMLDKERKRVKLLAMTYPAVLVDNVRLDDYRWKFSEYGIEDSDTLTAQAAFSLAAMTGQMPMLYMGEPGHVYDPLAAPLCAEDLSYLPRTFLTICEFDYLRLQAEAFVRKLEREGVSHKAILYKGMDHEYIDRLGYCPQAYDSAIEIASELRAL